jgi:hypothetical protein
MPDVKAAADADRNFVLQQGLETPAGMECSRVSSALLFQPRLVGLTALVGTIWQLPAIFGALALALWWSSLLPRLNPFEFIYNRTLGRTAGATRLGPAPAPRRFAQGMAATFATAICVAMVAEFRLAAYVLQGLLLIAVSALVFGRFCLGSFVYHLLRGRLEFAVRTLPWGRGD